MSATDLITGWKDMEAALPGYLRAERYYEGTAKEVFASRAIEDKIKASASLYRFNLAKTPVQVLAQKVKLAAVTGKTDAVTDLITRISDANNLEVEFPDLVRLALEYGDAYLMVWPVEDEEDIPEDVQPDPDLMAAKVELVVHNPKHARMLYDPANRRRKWFWIKRWCVAVPDTDKTVWRVDLWYAGRVEHWVSKVSHDNLNEAQAWEPFTGFSWDPDSAVDAVEVNAAGEIPAFHFRTAIPYGVPVHRDAYGAQDALTKIMNVEMNTVDHAGFPARYALSDEGAELDQAQDDPDFPDGDDANAPTGSPNRMRSESTLKSGAGTLTHLRGVKSVVQMDAADSSTLLDPAKFVIGLMAQQTWIPMDFFDPAGEVPSGESLKVKRAPLNEHAEDLQTAFTSPTKETWRFVLSLVDQESTVEVRWEPVQVASDKADWETVGLKQDAGVPQEQTLMEAGYDQETVQKWLDDDAEAMDLMRRADLMAKVADAAQKMGAAVGSGVMTAEQAQQIIAMLAGVEEEPVEGPADPVEQAAAIAKAKADPAAGDGAKSGKPPAGGDPA